MDTGEIIRQLKASQIYATHNCGGGFKMSEAFLFDGTGPFSKEAKEVQEKLISSLKEREEELKKKMKRATTGAQTTTKAVNLGKLLEKVIPTMQDFKWHLPDCRFLGDPIDFINFQGLCNGQITSISFIEVKSGKARLNDHQKCIKDAIEDKKVYYKEFS